MTEPSEYVSAADLVGGTRPAEAPTDFRPPEGVLLAMRPFGRKVVSEGVPKPFEVIEAYCVEVGDGEYVDLGLRDVGWQFVMRELEKATPEAPWVIGTIEKKSRAFFLLPPTPEQVKIATEAVDLLVEDRNRQEAAEAEF